MNIVRACGWVLGVSILGCGSTEMTATGAVVAPRAPNCDFEIMTSTPLVGFKEVGTVDVTPGPYGVNQFTNLGEFKEHIRENVCQLGGDAAIASANGLGMYIKASVLQRVAGKPSEVASAPAPAPAPAHKAGGCEFDTQCKGERICVENECRDPAPKPAAAEKPDPAPASPAAAPVAASTSQAPSKAGGSASGSKVAAPALTASKKTAAPEY